MRTNHLLYDFHEDAFYDKYTVYCISGEMRTMWKNPILDVLKDCPGADSISYDRGAKCYVLVKREDEWNFAEQAAYAIQQNENCTMEEVTDDLEPRRAAQLLLNAIYNYTEGNSLFNLTGRCYSICKKKKGRTIVTLDISIDPRDQLQVKVRTFTRRDICLAAAERKNKRKAAKLAALPRYKENAAGLERAADGDYILSHDTELLNEEKSMVNYLNLSKAGYEQTKLKTLHQVIRSFNRVYKGIMRLELETAPVMEQKEFLIPQKADAAAILQDILSQSRIVLVDGVCSQSSAGILADMCQYLQDSVSHIFQGNNKGTENSSRYIHHLPVNTAENITPDALNLYLIHNKDYYKDSEDPYQKQFDAPVQHIVAEQYTDDGYFSPEKFKPVVSALVFELIIKRDVAVKHISIFDWQALHLQEPVIFGSAVDKDSFVFVKVTENGDLDFCMKKSDDVIGGDPVSRSILLLQQDKGREGSSCGCQYVVIKGNQLNSVWETGLYAVPDMEQIHSQMKAADKRIQKGTENIHQIMNELIGLQLWKQDGCLFYLCGEASGTGLNDNVPRAAPARCVKAEYGSCLFFQDLFPTMATPFVRNKRYTVYPFPIKYLREYYRMFSNS